MNLLLLVSLAVMATVSMAMPSGSASANEVDGSALVDAESEVLSRNRRGCHTHYRCYYYFFRCGYRLCYYYRCYYYTHCTWWKRSTELLREIPQGNATYKEVFDFLDQDGNGNITACEWTTADNGTVLDFAAFIEERDEDGNEMLSFDEFEKIPLEIHGSVSMKPSDDDADNDEKDRKDTDPSDDSKYRKGKADGGDDGDDGDKGGGE